MTLATTGINPVFGDGYKINMASGSYTGDGSATANINLGFTPKYVKIINITDVQSWEWIDGMPATDTLYQTNAADLAIDTNTVIVTNGKVNAVTEPGVYQPSGNGAGLGTLSSTSVNVWAPDQTKAYTLQLSTNALVNNKAYVWVAFG